MSQVVQLNLPDNILERAHQIASLAGYDVQTLLVDWLQHAADDVLLDSLPDDRIVALAELQFTDEQQTELSDLLAHNGEGELTTDQRVRLDELMELYGRGMEIKSAAYAVAVKRGLKPSLSR